ncbi:hypothetical protein G6M89_09840 [Natronolimnobius sp. AArcel1]|uniref:CARDB domain-containing protein n=1 Tax=Natronolimnobius sp. AArcel1 TaxID=1679093 RepID=UPI0013EDEFA4|nr:CARDB domain-containing protein [Natronolimnobius sp. AArcel1]NGM69304.1 hypothetical protein [Natronolimnobius sp. AArcel1]
MRRGDDRAVTVQIGAVLLLAILFSALALYQINVVPDQNAEVEYNHNERVTGEMVELRDAMRDTDHESSQGVPITLGAQYDTRTMAVNPSDPTGTVRTVEPETPITIENADIGDPIIDGLLEESLDTKFIQYDPHYNEYQDAPKTNIEHTLLYNEFGHANVTLEEQHLIRDDQLTLFVIDGNLSRTDQRTVSVDVERLGGPGDSTLESDGATITIPTNSPDRWNDSVGTSFDDDSEEYARVTDATDDSVTIELDDEQTFDLSVAKVGVGDGGERDDRFSGDDSSESGEGGGSGGESDPVQGPLVTTADAPAEVTQGNEFTLSGTATSIGTESHFRSGTPIVGGQWESDGPDGENTGTLDIDGDPESLENVNLEDEITTEIDTDEWETGEHTLTVWGQDASGRVSSLGDTANTSIEVRDPPEDEPSFSVSIDEYDDDVTAGEDAEFTTNVQNDGGEAGTQDIVLDVDGQNVAEYETLELEPGESAEVTLTWQTEQVDTGERAATVSSDEDSDTVEVRVNEAEVPGFDLVYISDVNGFVQPSEERQTIQFALDEGPEAWEDVVIDLSNPNDGGVDYTDTFGGDYRIERGSGQLWNSGETLVYQIDDSYEAGEIIELSVGSYATDGTGGPYDVAFTRTDTDETAITDFEIDGEEGADDPFVSVGASDVDGNAGPGTEQQTFTFTPGSQIEPNERVLFDISEPNGDGVTYGWDVSLEQGSGEVWREGDEIVYQAGQNSYAGEGVEISITLEGTDREGGPYDVGVRRTDTGDETTTTFEIIPPGAGAGPG